MVTVAAHMPPPAIDGANSKDPLVRGEYLARMGDCVACHTAPKGKPFAGGLPMASPIDMASLDKWDDYTRAKEAMFFETDTADSPWTVIKSDCKKRARLNALRYVLHKLQYTRRDLEQVGKLDPLIVGRAHVVYERGEKPGVLM